MKLSIIIPVFNEEKTISEIIKKVGKAKIGKGIQREIIVVNDASTDKTADKLRNISGINVFHHRINQGKGAAVRTGLEKAVGDIILIQDGDLEYDPNDYSKLISPIVQKKVKVVYGSRLKDYPVKIFGENNVDSLRELDINFNNAKLTLNGAEEFSTVVPERNPKGPEGNPTT